jgi:hypothetical protein
LTVRLPEWHGPKIRPFAFPEEDKSPLPGAVVDAELRAFGLLLAAEE